MGELFKFDRRREGGLHWWVMTAASETDVVPPLWPGLWQLDYSDDESNPYLRFGVNNVEGESLAVWRALVWAVTATPGALRVGLPVWDRDIAARCLNVALDDVAFVRWEYEIDVDASPFADANRGFVAAQSAMQDGADVTQWHRDHEYLAGLFELATFDDLTSLAQAVSFASSSEFSVFGLRSRCAADLTRVLNQQDRPMLEQVLAAGDVFADMAVTHDRFPGTRSYVSFASHEDLEEKLTRCVQHCEQRWQEYQASLSTITSFADFSQQMSELLQPPGPRMTAPPR